MGEIAVFVQNAYAKQTYSQESYNVRAWPGLEMVVDALKRSGYEIEYCSSATAHEYRIILASITSACDWWSFIAERLTWRKGNYTVIVGGAGVLNIRPFLQYADIFVIGRAENIVAGLVKETLSCNEYYHPSVVYAAQFSPDKKYSINQSDELYGHQVALSNGKPFNEKSIGCQQKCLFCNYSWGRKHVGGLQGASGSFGEDDKEKTILELDLSAPESWGQIRMVGLDGLSERLRFMVNKKISNQRLHDFFKALSRRKAQQLKLYTIVGYPTETDADYEEFLDVLQRVDAECREIAPQYCLALNCSHFRSMPCTPAAWWPMRYENYRGEVAKRLRRRKLFKSGAGKSIFFQGRAFWAIETMGTDSLSTAILDSLCIRGTETDADIIKKLALFKKFWSSDSKTKQATLEKYCDIDRLFKAYSYEDYPVKYLESYISSDKMYKIGQRCLNNGLEPKSE